MLPPSCICPGLLVSLLFLLKNVSTNEFDLVDNNCHQIQGVSQLLKQSGSF